MHCTILSEIMRDLEDRHRKHKKTKLLSSNSVLKKCNLNSHVSIWLQKIPSCYVIIVESMSQKVCKIQICNQFRVKKCNNYLSKC